MRMLTGRPVEAWATVSDPDGLAPIENPYLLWRGALHTRWPTSRFETRFPIVDAVRSVKAAGELALLKQAAAATGRRIPGLACTRSRQVTRSARWKGR